MANSTEAFLHAHGIRVRPETMDRLVAEAIERLPHGLYPEDPRSALTPAEVEVLEKGGFDLDVEDFGDDDPLAKTAAEYGALLKTSLTPSEVAERLGVEPGQIRRRLTRRPPTLYGIRMDSGWRIPQFQFHGDSLLPGFSEVVAELDPEHHPVAILRWFTTLNPDLVVEERDRRLSPYDWLRLGLPPDAVVDLARHL